MTVRTALYRATGLSDLGMSQVVQLWIGPALRHVSADRNLTNVKKAGIVSFDFRLGTGLCFAISTV